MRSFMCSLKSVLVILFPITLILSLAGCATSPMGRKQLTVMSESQMNSMGANSFEELKRKMKISQNARFNQLTKCLSRELLNAAEQNPNEWEVVVFAENSPNAFALPGNKIGVHTGMIQLAQNPDQLAAVIGHEIGHVLAQHGNERTSQALLAQGGIMAANIALGDGSPKRNLLLAGIGLGAQFGILMPFSRKHETEADKLGVQYMAKAGYDPLQASRLWVTMGQKAGGSPPEFLSTHPSPDSRVRYLESYGAQFTGTYQTSRSKARCR